MNTNKTNLNGVKMKEGSSNYLTVMLSLIALGVVVIIIMLISQFAGGNNMKLADNAKNTFSEKGELANNKNLSSDNLPSGAVTADIAIENTDNIRGNINAPITILEYSDFQCPYCARFHSTMEQIIAEYPEDVRWVYKHFPIDSIHPMARKLAEASECAADQDKFWEYSDEVYNNQKAINNASPSAFAKNIGLDMEEFNDCFDSAKYAERVRKQEREGQALGVNGTPGSFINGVSLGGAAPYANLKQMIDEILE